MVSRLAVYNPPGRIGFGANVFGKDVANNQLFRALARYGGFEQIDIACHATLSPADLAQDLFQGRPTTTRVGVGDLFSQEFIVPSGVLLRGQPNLERLAWLRSASVGDRAYSLVGLSHTLAPAAVRDYIAAAVLAPVQPWDAIICTSPAVQDALTRMFEDWCDHLAVRFGGQGRPMPRLPLIPLGVDGPAMAAQADRPDARAQVRERLGLGPDDILVLWVGRLSFFEKAFPQPMFKAVEQAAQATGAKVHFALAGWFPDPELHRPAYEQAAATYAPSVVTHFLDGNDAALVGELWAGSDIFLSLVDNIQETIGITPLEAMASGLPVVVSDWDGYRYTVRDGIEGFLIPTLGGPPGPVGRHLMDRHANQVDAYQLYVAQVAQHTAVNVGRCAEAIADLIRSKDLRARMGAAGRARIADAFDWPVIVARYQALFDELAQIRAGAPATPGARRSPVNGDPFEAFRGFATQTIGPDTQLRLAPGADLGQLRATGASALDSLGARWRADLKECAQIMEMVQSGEARTLADVLARFAPHRQPYVPTAVGWMCKLGLLDWL